MKKMLPILAFGLSLGQVSLAATVAIIDSGVDYKHKEFAAKIWSNPDEIASNGKDDDSNSYIDDMMGWNFAEGNNQVIDYKYLNTFSPDCTKFFEIQGRIIKGTATQADKDFYAAKKADEAFLKQLSTFGNFIHGTHVSGISANASNDKLIAVKLIPTEPPGLPFSMKGLESREGVNPLIEILLGFLAQQQSKPLIPIGQYLHKENAAVANGSFGVSVNAVKPLLAGLIEQFTGSAPSDADLEAYAIGFVGKIVTGMTEFVTASPNTLFVFAAGNDGTDNDKLPASPANVKTDNAISVAATLDFDSLASFSNYGAKMVEVAAPGVVIMASIPGDQYLEMSGTSMAAPYVTNAASRVLNANPKLKPAEVKAILMKTVDVKSFLAGKVVSSGIVNAERAVKAAELSNHMELTDAIESANIAVEAVQVSRRNLKESSDMLVLPLRSLWF